MLVLLSAAAAMTVTAILTPLCRQVSRRFGWVDQPDARKLHRAPIPRAGGIAIILGYAAGLGLHGDWRLLPAVLAAFATGLLDDLVGLRPRTKIAGQAAAALLACAAGIQAFGAGAWWHLPLTIVWLVGCTNALNLIDGLDGLAAGLGIVAALAAAGTGNPALALLAAPLAGALAGFLPYNFSPASIFMGDCGSNTVGFLLGCCTLEWSKEAHSLAESVAPLVLLAIPILDASLAIVRRYLRSGAIFAADRGHIHHRLLARGFSAAQAAGILYAGAGVAGLLALLLAGAGHRRVPALAAGAVLAGMALQYLQYEEFACLRRVVEGRQWRRALSADLALREFERTIAAACSLDECWREVADLGRVLGFYGASMQVYGRTYSALSRDAEVPCECWNLRIPVTGAGVIEFAVPYGISDAAACADSLRRALAPRLEALRPQLAFAAVAGRRRP